MRLLRRKHDMFFHPFSFAVDPWIPTFDLHNRRKLDVHGCEFDLLLDLLLPDTPFSPFHFVHHTLALIKLCDVIERRQSALPRPLGSSSLYHFNLGQTSWQTMP